VTEQHTAPRRSRLSGEQRRVSIVAAATEVFAEVGYQRGTTAAVARRVGVSEPVVFQNFGTKAALFAAVVRHVAVHACAWVEQLAAQEGSVTGLVRVLLAPVHLHHIHAPGSFGARFAAASSTTGEPEIEAAAREATQRFATTLAALLETGRRSGELRADLDTEAAAWWLLSLVASHRFRHATAPAKVEDQLVAATITFLAGS
jgi:AcrR family transcriptional regulator